MNAPRYSNDEAPYLEQPGDEFTEEEITAMQDDAAERIADARAEAEAEDMEAAHNERDYQ